MSSPSSTSLRPRRTSPPQQLGRHTVLVRTFLHSPGWNDVDPARSQHMTSNRYPLPPPQIQDSETTIIFRNCGYNFIFSKKNPQRNHHRPPIHHIRSNDGAGILHPPDSSSYTAVLRIVVPCSATSGRVGGWPVDTGWHSSCMSILGLMQQESESCLV